MQARTIKLHHNTEKKLIQLKQSAERDNAYRVAKRIHAVLLNHSGNTSGEIARLIHVSRTRVSEWLKNYDQYGLESLYEGHRSGRPPRLNQSQMRELSDIIESGPISYGFLSGVWTSIMITEVIFLEFSIKYHPGHVRKILHEIGFSVQRPKRKLANADPIKQDKWRRYTYPNIKKKTKDLNATIIFEDEASFRQDSTLHATWAKRGQQPLVLNTGGRKSVKIFGCIDVVNSKFYYRREDVFNAQTYLRFLEQIAKKYYPQKVFFIQDNASYHKKEEVWLWFKENRKWMEVFNLPPYSPEFNAVEPLWHHTRMKGTHNRYFESEEEIYDVLKKTFASMQQNPKQIQGYIDAFF